MKKKNHQFLIEAFSKINDDSNLIIIGDGRLSSELKVIAKDLGIENRVHFGLGILNFLIMILTQNLKKLIPRKILTFFQIQGSIQE